MPNLKENETNLSMFSVDGDKLKEIRDKRSRKALTDRANRYFTPPSKWKHKKIGNSFIERLEEGRTKDAHSFYLKAIAKALGIDNWRVLVKKEHSKKSDTKSDLTDDSIKTMYCPFFSEASLLMGKMYDDMTSKATLVEKIEVGENEILSSFQINFDRIHLEDEDPNIDKFYFNMEEIPPTTSYETERLVVLEQYYPEEKVTLTKEQICINFNPPLHPYQSFLYSLKTYSQFNHHFREYKPNLGLLSGLVAYAVKFPIKYLTVGYEFPKGYEFKDPKINIHCNGESRPHLAELQTVKFIQDISGDTPSLKWETEHVNVGHIYSISWTPPSLKDLKKKQQS